MIVFALAMSVLTNGVFNHVGRLVFDDKQGVVG
jgi:hypothetical protein